MKVIAGLGNPGPEYVESRHNVGFLVLDHLARRWAPGAIARSKFHGLLVDGQIDAQRVLLVRPTTYMNRCGLSVAEVVRFFKVDPAEALLIVVDDVALPCGMIRIRPAGGAGGHNGLADIEQKLGTDCYARLRIGIDPPGDIPQKDYVLGRFRPDQLPPVTAAVEEAADAAACWAMSGLSAAMNQFNRKPEGSNSIP
jgi:peptidyl-tRNA hydrolase, PTH1 family